MIHTARGALSFETSSDSDDAPVAPSPAERCTAAASRSYATIVCPPRISRVVMLAPMRPSPTIPSCMRYSTSLTRAP